MHNIFRPMKINKMIISNRFIRSATMDNLGKQGMVTDKQIELYRKLSEGDIGLIISHGLFPTLEGQSSKGQLGVHTDETIASLNKLVNAVHENGGKIAAQILHGGFWVRPEVAGFQPIGPSAVYIKETGQQVRELASDEIHELVDSFVQASRRIIEAGFDAVQLHAAHGWLLSAFLSPVMNKRTDEWGGSPAKRARLLYEICKGIRDAAGPEYPILVKLGLQDYHEGGKSLSEGIEVAKIIESASVDAIEISGGIEKERGYHIRLNCTQPYYLQECSMARKALSLPLILVGGMRRLQDMQSVLDEGIADAISMCRPFIRDPLIVRKFREGTTDYSDCNSCNLCIEQSRKGNIRCMLS